MNGSVARRALDPSTSSGFFRLSLYLEQNEVNQSFPGRPFRKLFEILFVFMYSSTTVSSSFLLRPNPHLLIVFNNTDSCCSSTNDRVVVLPPPLQFRVEGRPFQP